MSGLLIVAFVEKKRTVPGFDTRYSVASQIVDPDAGRIGFQGVFLARVQSYAMHRPPFKAKHLGEVPQTGRMNSRFVEAGGDRHALVSQSVKLW